MPPDPAVPAAPTQPSPANGATPPPAPGETPAAPEAGSSTPDHESIQRQLAIRAGRAERQAQAHQQRIQELEAKLAESTQNAERYKGDPLAALEAYGHTHESLTQHVIKAEKAPKSAEQARIEALEAKIEQLTGNVTETQQTWQQREQQQRFDRRLSVVQERMSAAPDDYAAILDLDRGKPLLEAIEADEQRRGYDYSSDEIFEVLRQQEQKAREVVASQAKALARRPWARELFQSVLSEATQSPAANTGETATPTDPPARRGRKPKTVTNEAASETSQRSEPSPLGRQERINRAAERVRRNMAQRTR